MALSDSKPRLMPKVNLAPYPTDGGGGLSCWPIGRYPCLTRARRPTTSSCWCSCH